MSDNVNHPSHYAEGWSNGAELIDITENLDFCRGNAMKYLGRAGRKDPDAEIEDLEKAQWYVNRALERARRVSRTASFPVKGTGNFGNIEEFTLNFTVQDFNEDLARKLFLYVPGTEKDDDFEDDDFEDEDDEEEEFRPGDLVNTWADVPEGWSARSSGISRFEADGVLYITKAVKGAQESGVNFRRAEVASATSREMIDDRGSIVLEGPVPELVLAVRNAPGESRAVEPKAGDVVNSWDEVPQGWSARYCNVSRFEVDGDLYLTDLVRERVGSGRTVDPQKFVAAVSIDQVNRDGNGNAIVLEGPVPDLIQAVRDELSEPEVADPEAGGAVAPDAPALDWVIEDCEGDFWVFIEEDGIVRRYCLGSAADCDEISSPAGAVGADYLPREFSPYTYVRPVKADSEEGADEPGTTERKPGDIIPANQVPDGWHFTLLGFASVDYLQWQGQTLASDTISATTPSSPMAHFRAREAIREVTLVRREPERISAEKIEVELLDGSKITTPPCPGQKVVGWENVPEDWVATFGGCERVEVDGKIYLATVVQVDIDGGRPIDLPSAMSTTGREGMANKPVRLVRHDPELVEAVRNALKPQGVEVGSEVDPENPAQDWIVEDCEGDFWKLTEVDGAPTLSLMEKEAGTWDDGEGWGVPLSATFAPYTYVSPIKVDRFEDLPSGWSWSQNSGRTGTERTVSGDGTVLIRLRGDGNPWIESIMTEEDYSEPGLDDDGFTLQAYVGDSPKRGDL